MLMNIALKFGATELDATVADSARQAGSNGGHAPVGALAPRQTGAPFGVLTTNGSGWTS